MTTFTERDFREERQPDAVILRLLAWMELSHPLL